MNSYHTGSTSGFTMSRKMEDPLSVEFNPPLGSDALFYALSKKYPDIKTHQLRLQKAAIEFHLAEFEEESRLFNGSSENLLPSLPNLPLKSPWQMTYQIQTPHKLPVEEWPSLEPRVDSNLPHFRSMLGGFEKAPGSRRAHAKKPMSQKDREEYKVVKNVGACEKHRRQKKRCRCPFNGTRQTPADPQAASSSTSIRTSADTTMSTTSSPSPNSYGTRVMETQISTFNREMSQKMQSFVPNYPSPLEGPTASPFLDFALSDTGSSQVKSFEDFYDAFLDGLAQDHYAFEYHLPDPELPTYRNPVDPAIVVNPSNSTDWASEQSLWARTFGLSSYTHRDPPFDCSPPGHNPGVAMEHLNNFGWDQNAQFMFGPRAANGTSTTSTLHCYKCAVVPKQAQRHSHCDSLLPKCPPCDAVPDTTRHHLINHESQQLLGSSLTPLLLLSLVFLFCFKLYQFRRFVISCCRILPKLLNLRGKHGIQKDVWTCCECEVGSKCCKCGNKCGTCGHAICTD